MSRFLLVLSTLAFSSFFSGCSGSDLPELASVTGTVTLNGKPLADAVVKFTPQNARPSSAQTDTSGKFELLYLPDVEGAIIGQHTVTITVIQDEEADNLPEGSDQAVQLPSQATDGSIKKEVKSGETNDFKIEL